MLSLRALSSASDGGWAPAAINTACCCSRCLMLRSTLSADYKALKDLIKKAAEETRKVRSSTCRRLCVQEGWGARRCHRTLLVPWQAETLPNRTHPIASAIITLAAGPLAVLLPTHHQPDSAAARCAARQCRGNLLQAAGGGGGGCCLAAVCWPGCRPASLGSRMASTPPNQPVVWSANECCSATELPCVLQTHRLCWLLCLPPAAHAGAQDQPLHAGADCGPGAPPGAAAGEGGHGGDAA